MCAALGSTEINDVKYQAFAIAVLLRQETAELIHATEGCLVEPSGDFACRNGGDLEFGQAGNACLHLLRTVLQNCIHNRHTGRGVAQGVPFGDEGGELKLVQVRS